MSSTVACFGTLTVLEIAPDRNGCAGAHHPDVPHVVDRPRAAHRLERAVEHRQVRLLDVRRPLDRLVLVDVVDDLLDLRLRVAQLLQRHRHGLVDDLHHPAADQLLVLHQRDVGLDAGRVAVHHEADGPGRRQHRRLRVAEAVLLAHLDDLVPDRLRRLEHVLRDVGLVDVLDRGAMLPHHAQHRLLVLLVAAERTAVVARDPRRLGEGRAVHERGDRPGIVAARRRCRRAGRATSAARPGWRSRARADDRRASSSRSPASDSWRCRPGSPAPGSSSGTPSRSRRRRTRRPRGRTSSG